MDKNFSLELKAEFSEAFELGGNSYGERRGRREDSDLGTGFQRTQEGPGQGDPG